MSVEAIRFDNDFVLNLEDRPPLAAFDPTVQTKTLKVVGGFSPEPPYIAYELGTPLPTCYIDRDADPVIQAIFTPESKNKVSSTASNYFEMVDELSIVPMLRRGKLGLLRGFFDISDADFQKIVKR